MTDGQPRPVSGDFGPLGAGAAAPGPEADLRQVLVVGAGLMGTSVALALRQAGIEVFLHDTAPGRLLLAVEMGAGRRHDVEQHYDVALVAVPPSAVAGELRRLQELDVASTYTDLASVKAEPEAEAQATGVDMTTYVGGHPLAGRERSGPVAARADLFVGRPWVITDTAMSSPNAVAAVRALAQACGAVPIHMAAEDHDVALSTVSHLPHIVASLLAAQLVGCDDATVALGGTGLHDTTRVAAGDPTLWSDILAANARHLAVALARFQRDVQAAIERLDAVAAGDATAVEALTALLASGVAGRARVPVKHGARAAEFTTVPVLVRDAPGELAALFRALAEAGINIEDVRVEHEPGRPLGLVEIDVHAENAAHLIACVRASGWEIYG